MMYSIIGARDSSYYPHAFQGLNELSIIAETNAFSRYHVTLQGDNSTCSKPGEIFGGHKPTTVKYYIVLTQALSTFVLFRC